jgi:hypothetical protein
MAAAKAFWISFLDGLSMAGIFGQLRIPGDPVRLFDPAPGRAALDPAGSDRVEFVIKLSGTARDAAMAAEVIEHLKAVTRQETHGRLELTEAE